MATVVAVLEAQLRADTKHFVRNMREAETGMQRFGKIAKLGALAAGTGIAYGLGKVAKIGWDEFNQGQKVAAQTNAVLKSTGGVANVTAKDVERLGVELMKKSGIDDEVIKSGANILLTFKAVRNEVGKGNDIFNQATKTALDLSVAFDKDLNSSTILIGKALQDPIKGLTALRRVGVQFTAQQEDQIKAMVESGQTMKAQKFILAELESQVGGSAEALGKTLGGQINIVRERFNNWAGDMVAKAIPMLERLATWVRTNVVPALQRVAAVVREEWPAFRESLGTIFRLVQKMGPVFRLWLKAAVFVITMQIKLFTAYAKAFAAIIQTGQRVVDWFRGTFLPAVTGVWDAVRERARVAWDAIRGRVVGALERIRDVFALVRATAVFTWDFIRDKAQLVIDKVAAIIQKLKDMVAYIRSIPGKIKGALGSVGGFFAGLVGKLPGKGDLAAIDLSAAMGVSRRGVSSALNPAMGLAQSMGLGITSTYRPGASVRGSGSRSDHSYYPSKAVDFAGSASQMSRFARAVAGVRGVETVIYSPIGLWRGAWGAITSAITKADHYDHVHVDTFDRGGWLKPGWTLAGNFTGRPERVGGGGGDIIINVGNWFGSDRESARRLAEFLAPHLGRNVRMSTGHA